MAQQDSRYPEIKIPQLGGLNERVSPANLRPGEFDVLEGMYPAQTGLLRRIPGKTLLADLSGKILQIWPTYNVNGDVLVQATTGVYVYTLDELLGRADADPSLVFTPNNEEETMSMAIIVQREPNGTRGGSISGFSNGGGTETADTFYPRRLTHMLVNESSTVQSFTAATIPITTAASFGTFTLATGSYRISFQGYFAPTIGTSSAIIAGLYNTTDGAFQTQSGTADPILSTINYTPNSSITMTSSFDCSITVSGGSKTFAIYQKCSEQTSARSNSFNGWGGAVAMANANVNGAAATFYYAYLKILKVS